MFDSPDAPPYATFFAQSGHASQPDPASPQEFSLALLAATPDCVKVISLDGRLLFLNENGQCAMEIDNFAVLVGIEWAALWPDAARADIQGAIAAARAGGT